MKPLNFRTLFISITLFLLQFNSVTAQVALDSAAVNASFYGIFNRTKIELFISNKSNIDNLEYRTRFKINKNAFVDNLLLEIEGELEDGLTVSRESGRKIYEEITGRRIDPAYLVKNSDGSYTLNVFPVNKKQTRRIVIEYFSIPEPEFETGSIYR